VAVVVGEPEMGDEVAALVHGLLDEGGFDVGERNLAARNTSSSSWFDRVHQRSPIDREPRVPWTNGPPKSRVPLSSRRTVTSKVQCALRASPATNSMVSPRQASPT
jgi:hypothetical protein